MLLTKADVIKVLFQHTGAIIGNKLTKHRKKKAVAQPLRQISNYVSFTPVDDLREKQSRNGNSASSNGHKSGSPAVGLSSTFSQRMHILTGSKSHHNEPIESESNPHSHMNTVETAHSISSVDTSDDDDNEDEYSVANSSAIAGSTASTSNGTAVNSTTDQVTTPGAESTKTLESKAPSSQNLSENAKSMSANSLETKTGMKSIDQLRTPPTQSRSSSIYNGEEGKSLRSSSTMLSENNSSSSPFSKLKRLASRLHDDDADNKSTHSGEHEDGKKKSHFLKGLGLSSRN
ncbi:Uncharacterized protein YPR117W [Sugiyamaella lignohabitans]|uniref:Uncharacterized protein YPR117W n=1 Tax=Sugiyamaella lignohabitans TaxID=796027 RepID=A0A167DRE4_9ASCO|nr:Uncharacterized protein YPR117W [Sugiyamaella lignohabitans]ANB13201.1 Uncharacterized protein YPR117W [Sugiyamaella lignohabitans]